MIRALCVIGSTVALALAAAPALAEKPEWAGQGKGHGKGKGHEKHGKHFDDGRRVEVRSYYEQEFRGGHCPPGLAKKHNGCMPPGQAKKWAMGQPLPANVVVYDLPPPLVVRIGMPPAGYKYVRAGADILMIAVGSKLVVDAVRDLGRI